MTKATVGGISHGTLRDKDLLAAFADELDRLESDHDLTAEARAVLLLLDNGWGLSRDRVGDLLCRLMDELDEHAPMYCRFGAHDGDGSDFGFWPDLSALEELPRVGDPSEVATMGTDCVFVNDHGNMTVFAADGSVVFDCV